MDYNYDPEKPAYKFENIHDRFLSFINNNNRIKYLDEEEMELFQILKQKFSSYKLSDNTLLRFLSARG